MSILIFILVFSIYLIVFPYWYGDSVWYALSIKEGKNLFSDPGHLLWRPLGALLSEFLPLDPLKVLQLLSAIFGALAVLIAYKISLKLFKDKKTALIVGIVLAGSNMMLSYSGSGSSYTASMAFSLLAFNQLLNNERNKTTHKDRLIAAIFLSLSWGFWGVAVLLYPAFFILNFLSLNFTFIKRVLISSLYTFLSITIVIVLTLIAYALNFQEEVSFLSWLNSSSHGIIKEFSLINLVRAILGVFNSLIHIGSLGTSLKNIIFGDITPTEFNSLTVPLVKVLLLSVLFLLSLISIIKNKFLTEINIIFFSLFIPIFIFAASWQGSDIERYSLVLPFLIMILIGSIYRILNPYLTNILLISVVVVLNFITLIVPNLLDKGGIVRDFAPTLLSENLKSNSIVIILGQKIPGTVVPSSYYFNSIDVYNLSTDSASLGSDSWKQRLESRINNALLKGGEISVISDIKGIPTVGGLILDENIFPHPNLSEVVEYFKNWSVKNTISYKDIKFCIVER